MAQRGYPGIHAGMPTPQCLRSASVVNGASRSKSKAKQERDTSSIYVAEPPPSRASPLPQEKRDHPEPGRLLGRLALDVDLGAPLTTLAERRHAEPKRGTEWWGRSVLVTFDWAGFRASQK
ncbi:hypothetical protein CVG87_08950 [Pseudomonas sp. WCS365]|nr:hypothetical protein CVG87_08950 [Pseudomonas sp. WCS365]